MNVKPFAYILIVLVVLNLIFFAFGMVPQLVFWAVIIIVALIAWQVLPRLREDL